MDTKRVAIVAGHFPPSNLTAVHRSRLICQHLPELGWEPTIVTTHWDYYEEALDWDLAQLVSPDLSVIRTRALSVKPIRLIGDIGVRAMYWHYRALSKLFRSQKYDFLWITIPSNFSAVLGRLLLKKYGVPYGIDYIDPWVHRWPGVEKRFSRAWFSYRLSEVLEPWSVAKASLISGVAPLYYESVLERNPRLRGRVKTRAMPYGFSRSDYEQIRNDRSRDPFLFSPTADHFNLIYAGALLPRAMEILEKFLLAVKQSVHADSETAKRLRVHFVGTGKDPMGARGGYVAPYITQHDLGEWVSEHPARIAYADVINHLVRASGVLILGSTEAHYTPSKVFEGLLSRRPLFAMLHSQSTASQLLHDSAEHTLVTVDKPKGLEPEVLSQAIVSMVHNAPHQCHDPGNMLDAYSAKESARVLVNGMESVLGE